MSSSCARGSQVEPSICSASLPPNSTFVRIEAVAAVKLFEIERPERIAPAVASQGRRPHAAACDSFCSSRSTRVDGRKHRDPALASSVAGKAGGTKVLTPDLFATYFAQAHDRKSSGRQLLLQCENRSTGSEEVGHRGLYTRVAIVPVYGRGPTSGACLTRPHERREQR